MANLNDLAADLFGTRRLESGVRTGGTNNSSGISGGSRTSNGGSSLSSTVGLATSDSQDGKVTVRISDYTTTSDIVFDDSVLGPEIEIGTTVDVKAGDYVHITLINHDKGSQPIVMGVIGGGDRVVKEIEERAEALNERMDDVEEDVTNLESRVITAEDKVTAIESDITTLNSRVVTAENKVTAMESDITTIEGDITTLNSRIVTAEDKITTVENNISGLEDRVDDAEDKLDVIEPKLTDAIYTLSNVENVVDTLNWITEHGTMTLTEDVTPMPGKIYFVVNSTGDYFVGGIGYSIVESPSASAMNTYYELFLDKSIENYIMTHLALMNDGLHVVGDSAGIVIGNTNSYHIRITNNRLSFMEQGQEVAYITNRELYIPKAVVAESLRIGMWRWELRANGNFALFKLSI